jgi:hypothetical protein
MYEFFSNMSGFEKALWLITIPSTIILLFQLVITIFGMDSSDGVDVDTDTEFDSDSESGHSPFQLFTFRNLIAFFAVFGWTAISLTDEGVGHLITIVISLFSGTISMVSMASLVYFMYKLKEENIPSIKSALGKNATVYLTIPEKGKGRGKVTIEINGTQKTISAYSVGPEFKTKSRVKVVSANESSITVDSY